MEDHELRVYIPKDPTAKWAEFISPVEISKCIFIVP